MIAMRNSVNQIYKNNPKAGMCEPMIEMPDEGRLSAMSTTMTRQLTSSMKMERKSVQKMPKFTGPHVAGFAVDKQHMPVVTNDSHCANTNNGFARKPCGGFYFHWISLASMPVYSLAKSKKFI